MPPLGIFPNDASYCYRDSYSTMSIASLFTYPRLEKTLMSFNQGMDKENMAHLHNEVLGVLKKEILKSAGKWIILGEKQRSY